VAQAFLPVRISTKKIRTGKNAYATVYQVVVGQVSRIENGYNF